MWKILLLALLGLHPPLTASEIEGAHIRIARPTDQMSKVLAFYCKGLGFEVLFRFEDHKGFDGVMVGHPKAAYHLEFTHHRGHDAGRAPGKDNLLVFYLPDSEAWQAALTRMKEHGYLPVPSYNPYWDKYGKSFEDPDGYRIVLFNKAWK